MCGIACIWNRDGVFTPDEVDKIIKGAERRGQDGIGISVYSSNGSVYSIKEKGSYSVYRDKILNGYGLSKDIWRQGSLMLVNCRAQPETEVETSELNMQPLQKFGCCITHNGSVADISHEAFKGMGYITEVDSEAILNAYIDCGRDVKNVMGELYGGFGFLLFDSSRNRLYCVNDFKPLAIGYVRGRGLILHSCLDTIKEVIDGITGCSKCGTNVWEDYYYHWQDGYTIREVDLDSGMERLHEFKSNFYHPVWRRDSLSGNKLVLVSASGGIDSGLSAFVMRKIGYDVKLVNFNYGQKGAAAEEHAAKKLAINMGAEFKCIKLGDVFSSDVSSLIKDDVDIETSKEGYIKTTTAWVSNRNSVFLSILVSLAEQEILSNKYDEVYIVSGMSNLSEEGFYPDNSEYFIRSFFESIKYSTIVGDRIKYMPVMQNIMKSEEWILGSKLGFPFEYTVSCDCPRLVMGEKEGEVRIELCNQCGSTLLSRWAAEMAGVKDQRSFYDRVVDFELVKKKFKGKTKSTGVKDIISRLILPEERDRSILLVLLKLGLIK